MDKASFKLRLTSLKVINYRLTPNPFQVENFSDSLNGKFNGKSADPLRRAASVVIKR